MHLPGPLNVPASLASLGIWGDDGIDRWDGSTLVRTVRGPASPLPYRLRSVGALASPVVEVEVSDTASLPRAVAAAAALFISDGVALARLLRVDPLVAEQEARHPGLRPTLQPDLLTALVRSISAQQVNLRWAATTRRRLAEAFGTRHDIAGTEVYSLDPDRLAAADPAAIRALQFTTRKAEYIVVAAQAVASGRLRLDELSTLPDTEVVARLVALRGLGVWSAEWLLARTLGRPCVVAGDLGVRKAVGLVYGIGALPAERLVRSTTAHWGAAAAMAQTLILHALLDRDRQRRPAVVAAR
ncbi:MAG: DNA-3-methyladenine glycosylase [Candidatus Dormibacteria bacterium]